MVKPAVDLYGQLDASEDDIDEEQRATEGDGAGSPSSGNSSCSKKPVELPLRGRPRLIPWSPTAAGAAPHFRSGNSSVPTHGADVPAWSRESERLVDGVATEGLA